MPLHQFHLPDIGEGIAEAEVVAWHVAKGDEIAEDAPLADVMTDKATVEITSPVSGRVVDLAGAVGDMVAIGAVLATFEVEGKGEGESARATLADPPLVGPAMEDSGREQANELPEPVLAEPDIPLPAHATCPSARVLASPAVRERARQLAIDLAQVHAAQGRRIRHSDLDAYLGYNRDSGYPPTPPARADVQVRVIGLRRRIAENMAASKRHIPHFSLIEEIDVTKLEALRSDLNMTRGEKPRLTLLPLIILGICRALPDFPMINATYDDQAGVVNRSGAVHLGIATQTKDGLMVPVIRQAEGMNVWQLAREIARLSDAARSGKALSAELSGSTLTITSLGPLGGIATTPVINRPEVAIIGPNKIVERPVFVNGQIAAAKLMNLSISCDHRVVDGWDAANFMQAVKRLLETPALLFAV